jgi:hypothetical protein
MQLSGTLAARALSGASWAAGRVIYIILLAIFRRDPRALAILATALVAIAVAIRLIV